MEPQKISRRSLLMGSALASVGIPLQAQPSEMTTLGEGVLVQKTGTQYDIRQFGAVGDGSHLDTDAIQRAIDECHAAGGGIVVAPPGTYRTGAIRLRSHVTFDVSSGARIIGSDNLDDYRIDEELVGLISAVDGEDIHLIGQGTLDGNGDAFADWESLKPGGSAEFHIDGPVAMHHRPGNMITFSNCRNISMTGLTIVDAPFWTIHLDGCTDGSLANLRIRNNPLIPNNDGIHCTTSRNVRIQNCDIVAGDDAIAITGINDHGPIIPGFIGYDQPTENILVNDCILESRSVGVRVGYGHNDVRHCIFSNLIIRHSHRGLGVFSRNSGSIQNIAFSNIQIETRFYDGPWWGNGEAIHVSTAPQFSDEPLGEIQGVAFQGIRASSPTGILLHGDASVPIRDLTLRDIELRMAMDPLLAERATTMDIQPANMESHGILEREPAALFCKHIDGLNLTNVTLRWDILEDAHEPIRMKHVEHYQLNGLSFTR